ncbi:hypothetical protein D9M72_586290 [compost metagenome]
MLAAQPSVVTMGDYCTRRASDVFRGRLSCSLGMSRTSFAIDSLTHWRLRRLQRELRNSSTPRSPHSSVIPLMSILSSSQALHMI